MVVKTIRIRQRSDPVDQAQLERLGTGEDPTAGQFVDIFRQSVFSGRQDVAFEERDEPPVRFADVLAKLNRYLTIIQKLIYENDGNVDKVNGDGIMAFWGVPHTSEIDECNAAFTALQMQRHIWSFNLDLQAENQPPIHMGIGLNTGDFIAGNVGSEDKIEFTLIQSRHAGQSFS